MREDLVFKRSREAQLSAFFDPECKGSGYKLKKFKDGYRYFPLGNKKTYVIRNAQIAELGQHILTCYWSCHLRTVNEFKCIILPFKCK